MTDAIGHVVGNTSPVEFNFHLKGFAAKLGDLVTVETEVPGTEGRNKNVLVWGRITELHRFNPFLPVEAAGELAEVGLSLTDTVLSNTRDQIEGRVLVLGRTSSSDTKELVPLNYPVQPGSSVRLPRAVEIKRILIGKDSDEHRIRIGALIGRRKVEVSLKTNIVVARHIAILAMTGGGKTVAARQIIKELIVAKYPLLIFDPHGDYLGFWENRDAFDDVDVKLFYPHLKVNEENRAVIGYLIGQMTQGLSDAQKEIFNDALETIRIGSSDEIDINLFIDSLLSKLRDMSARHPGTIPAVKRALRLVRSHVEAMELSNERLRSRLADFPWSKMPDPLTESEKFVKPGRISIVYLGGYDHMTQSTMVALVLRNLFDERASMRNKIAPFFTVIEEAHNFIPSRGEGQSQTASVEIIRKVITEGRKFGVGLMLVSQRPSRLDETTLSQCNTFLVFRLVNPRDQAFVAKVMENLSKADARLLPGFGPGEGIVSGQAVRFPLVIKVDFDEKLMASNIGHENFIEQSANWSESEEARLVETAEQFDSDIDA